MIDPAEHAQSLNIPDRYKQKDSWPHQWVKVGKPYQHDDGRMGQPLMCTYCHSGFIQGIDPRPYERCRARTDKTEMRRLLG